MTILFDPTGILDISTDAGDLSESGDGFNISSDALTRCKNLRINQKGVAKTRDGSAKLNATAINTAIWWIEEQGGSRITFAGTDIYENESSIKSGLTSAQWAAIQYNAFNDTAQNIFALNGIDRQRIESSAAYEWGIDAPTDAPTLSAGQATGLTGQYNAKYTYVRKVSGVTVAESNPSPEAVSYITLADQSLAVEVTAPTDAQVTHIRLYRTEANGLIYYRDQDIPVGTYAYGITHKWEGTGGYLSGEMYKFTIVDSTNSTDDTYSWEEDISAEIQDNQTYGGNDWFTESQLYYDAYVEYLLVTGGSPLSYAQFLALYGL